MDENGTRLAILYKKHNTWLLQVAYNIAKDRDVAEDLVSNLYLYLAEKPNQSIWYSDSFNTMYCRQFIISRFLNKAKRDKKIVYVEEYYDVDDVDDVYNTERDEEIDETYNGIMEELHRLKGVKGMWSSVMIYEMKIFGDMTLDEVANELSVSKSTVFLAVKKVKNYLKQKFNNPFIEE